ncbi:MAG: cob(I)alamin adenosyltransferase [Actinomycetota bacterium]|jgi:cob(I)alamin adenosyltransferase|nr:cob(I)alamin adenosyltransferase [Actinomycetota bacterium]
MVDKPPSDAPERPAPLRRMPSLLMVNTGDGKGKSTAAFGTAMRAVARGWRVAVVQFLKSGAWNVGEEKVGRGLGIDWFAAGDGFTWDSADLDESRAKAVAAWVFARDLIERGEHQLVILDEATYPMTWGWIDTGDVVAALIARPSQVTVIVTGRDAPEHLVDAADTVTEMRKVKHAYDAGIAARKGIDY